MLAHHDTINNIHHRSVASVTKFKMQCLVARSSQGNVWLRCKVPWHDRFDPIP